MGHSNLCSFVSIKRINIYVLFLGILICFINHLKMTKHKDLLMDHIRKEDKGIETSFIKCFKY